MESLLLIYDADCAFCTRCAEWAQRHLPAEASVVGWQHVPDLATYGLTPEQCNYEVQWVEDDGTVYGGAPAVGRALRTVGGVWGAMGRTLLTRPVRPAAAAVYRFVARNRGRVPGATCSVPE